MQNQACNDIKGLVADCSRFGSTNKAIQHWHSGISIIMEEYDLFEEEVFSFVKGLSFHAFIREYYAQHPIS